MNEPVHPAARAPSRLQLAGPAYAALLLLAFVAFWPGYLKLPKESLGFWVHWHAVSGTLWMLLLIVQPLAIRWRQRRLHRLLGRASAVLMPVVVVGFIGLAHSSIKGTTGSDFAVHAYFGYIRVVLVTVFVGAYVLGWMNRHDAPVHARYMICTGLAVIDPIFHRIAARVAGHADFNYQLLTFGLVCAVLVALIYAERRETAGKHVFPMALAAFVVGGLPPALDFHTWGPVWSAWKSFMGAFAALPVT